MSGPDWQNDRCRLYLGDALEKLRGIGQVDGIITDPPYSSGARRDAEKPTRGALSRMEDPDWFSHDTMTAWGFQWFMRSIFTEARALLSEGAHVYVFCDWRQTPNVYAILESCGYRVNHCLVWRKANFGMGAYWRNQHENIVFASLGTPAEMLDRSVGSVLDAANVAPSQRLHPTEKPLALIRQIVKAIPAETILDPFMGCGTTGAACQALDRQFAGIEIRAAYFDAACRRLSTGTQAEMEMAL